MYIGLRTQHPFFFSDFKEECIFSTDFRKILQYQILEAPSSGSRIFLSGQTNRQTGMTKLIVAFCNYANAPNK